MALKNLNDGNISDRVVEELRSAILSGEFAPGERLVERKLADRLGVSHIPVREALAILTEERLVERQPRRGARVSVLGARELEEIASLRSVLEQFVAVRVQERWNARAEARLHRVVGAMGKAVEAEDADKMFQLDRQFHEVMWSLSDHALLVEMTARLRGRLNGFMKAANAALAPAELSAHVMSHERIIQALASGDPMEAREAMAEHVAIAVERIEVFATD